MTIGFNYLGKLGQLGNQMFQYASTKGIASYHGVPFMIPNHDEVLVDVLGNKLHIELFNCFKIELLNEGFINGEELREEGFEVNRKFFSFDKRFDYNLVGFFQSEKYFKYIKDEIRKDFTFKDDIVVECLDIIDSHYDNPIALHVRRGDFLKNSGNHHNLSIDYYKEALSKFNSNRQVIVFTDDPRWAMEEPLFDDDRFIVSTGNSSYHDLYLMSQCNDFIIANSTFSWWGAWLANKGKVIAPSKWFGPNNSHLNTKDLYPDEWEVI